MSLKKRIVLSFFISSFIIAILAVFEYVNFIELRKEIRYLEITDTISRKSVQLRRHEKNYFLYSPKQASEEAAAVRDYLGQLKDILAQNPRIDEKDQLSLRNRISEYEQRFSEIEISAKKLTATFDKVKVPQRRDSKFIALVENTFLERPSQSANFLTGLFLLSDDHPLVHNLRELDENISSLRKTGEDILVISKDLDKTAREKAETVIRVSQIAILIFFPLFFTVGIGMLFLIGSSVVRRLVLLINVVEKTGTGSYPHLLAEDGSQDNPHDEVGVLIEKFNAMEDQLALRERELMRKNQELMQAKKLAAIGTLASGVAHELNNPLNNIYLSAQVLSKETEESCTRDVKEAVSDIVGQTERVKRIVGELLEFARGREPQFQAVELGGLINDAYRHSGISRNLDHVRFTVASEPPEIVLSVDSVQMEQVFKNLFINATDAMQASGELNVLLRKVKDTITISISDTGKGIPPDSQDKIFEPFFTTKDKGTGLGLAIVYNIIKKHDGDISVESEAGKGTTFKITLPVSHHRSG